MQFDAAIVGSGPTAYACLDGLPRSARVAVITGVCAQEIAASRVHPKIQSVAAERNEAVGVTDLFDSTLRGAKPLFSTAAVGGLANYWGQQVVRFRRFEPWPKDLFIDYDDYRREVTSIERNFVITGGNPLPVNEESLFSTPRLLAGTRNKADAGLEAVREAMLSAASRPGVTIYPARAISIRHRDTHCTLLLDNGQEIVAHRILVAAGVVGSARLLMSSFPEIKGFTFIDHSPWMIYTIGLRPFVTTATSGDHFNAVTMERLCGEEATSFASIYDMSRADLSLILSSMTGRVWPGMRGWRAPPGASLLNPVQVWTSSTNDEIAVGANGEVTSRSQCARTSRYDLQLTAVFDALRRLGGRGLKTGRTVPGAGFHYHNLVLSDGHDRVSVNRFLLSRTGDQVRCADASVLTSIGCRPHTLTAMAAARRIASRLL